MTIGGILGESWRLYTKFFKRFFVIALIVYLIVNLLNAVVATLFGHGVGISLLLALITTVVSLVGTFWLQGALVFAVDDVRDGRIDTTRRTGVRASPPVPRDADPGRDTRRRSGSRSGSCC